MKRNIQPSSGSSDEDKTSLKKARKENSGKLKNTEAENTESIDGSKKRVTDCNSNVEASLSEVKRACTENADDQKTVKNETECNVNDKNDNSEDNNNGIDIITEIGLISRKALTSGRYKGYCNSCSGEAEVEDILQESICSYGEETDDEVGSSREQSMINDEEYVLLAETLTGLFRDIYRAVRVRNREEKSSKCQVSITHDKVSNVGKGKSYLCNKTRTSNEEKYNNSYGWGEVSDTSNVAERSDEGLGKETSDYVSDNEVRNEHQEKSNNLSFGEDSTNFKRDISSAECDRNMYEKSNISCNSEMNDEGLGKEISDNTYDEENGAQRGQTNKNRDEVNSNATEKTDNFADYQSNANPHEWCSTSGTSDEESDGSTDVKMRDQDGGDSGDEVHYKRCSDLLSDKTIKKMKSMLENGTNSDEGDSSELDEESDMGTDDEYSWSRVNESSSDEETNSPGTGESDNSSEEESGDDNTEISDEETDSLGTEESENSEEESDEDSTDESSDEVSSNYGEENSDTTSGEDDSSDSEVSMGERDTDSTSTDEDCNNESEGDNDDSERIDESLGDDKSTDFDDETDSSWEDANTLKYEKRSKGRDIVESSNSSSCEERSISTDPVAYYRGTIKENLHSGNDGSSVIHENVYAPFNYRSCKEIICSSSEEENSLGCAKECSSSETNKDLKAVENIRNKTPGSCSEVNDESDSEESKSSDDTGGLERFDNVLGFLSHRRLCIAMPGQDTISISVTQFKLMPLKDNFRESADGRHKKRVVASMKRNIITTSVIAGNFRDGKSKMRSRNTIKNKVSVKNKAAEVSDAEEQMSDEAELPVEDKRGRKSRNEKGNKQMEFGGDLEENDESDEDYNEGDEDSGGGAGADIVKGLDYIIKELEENGGEFGEYDSDQYFEADDESDVDEHEENEEVVEEEDENVEGKENEEEYDEEENIEEEEDNEEGIEEEENEEGIEEEENEEGIEEEENEEDIEDEEETEEGSEEEENLYLKVKNKDDSNDQSSENDDCQWNTKTKSRTMTKKKTTKEQVRGKKINLMKKKK